MYDPAIEDAITDTLMPDRFDELRAALLRHHNLQDISGVIVYSGCGWHIALGFGPDKIEGKGKTLGEAVEKAIQPTETLSPEEQLLKALQNDPSTLRLARIALGLGKGAR